MRLHRLVAVTVVALVIVAATPAGQAVSADSKLCGTVLGKTAKDRDRLLLFCSKGLVQGTVISALADDSIVWLKVTREFADAMRRDTLSAEQLVKTWMKTWRSLSGRNSVTVHVEWLDTQVAVGQTTLFSGDTVTIK